MTRRLSTREKLERKPTPRACTFCHSKHLQCLNTRPCLNCVKRKIGHECHDIVRKRAQYLMPAGEPGTVSDASRRSSSVEDFHGKSPATGHDPRYTPETAFGGFGEPEPGRATPASTPASASAANFNSMFLNQEYMMLGDLLSKPSLPLPLPAALAYTESAQSAALAETAGVPLVSSAAFFGALDREVEAENPDTRPYIQLGGGEGGSARENGFNFDLRASDEHEYVLPLLSHHIYQTVQDIYSNRIINFDYPLSYHSLTRFLKARFSVAGKAATPVERSRKRHNLLVILKLIASYRPTFISAHKSLFQPFDFQFLEMSFQRCLLDFENLSRLNASPMIIWRRTGEIVSMSAHLADILGLNISDVLSKRTFIIELMYDDESIVEYFRLFKSVAIGSLHLTIFTKCKLIKKPSHIPLSASKTNARLADVDFIEFCSVWTVKRDLFDLPMMIVGHFLPSLPNSDAIRPY